MDWVLNRTGLAGGIYRGFLRGGGEPPALEMALDDAVLGGMQVSAAEGGWRVEGDLGTAPLTEGVRTVAIRVAGGGAVLDTLTVVAGLDAAHDLRADLDDLRVELAQLKRAFRRHVAETE
ncbi:hypothetical protein [Jannaschia sp. W003]|uniref:hypothetical protein n=1 Tax=Jannaschia sp. W003 TaxID=2867012 RepID=UPI0021A44303|nr:hypothetical protein [Jannaschia sp. W003]UWQ21887.1 hypothetical protein K3554_02325 [Jannaschia sp. W003]